MRSKQKTAVIVTTLATIALAHCSPVKSSLIKGSGSSDSSTININQSNNPDNSVPTQVISSSSSSASVINKSNLTDAQVAALNEFQSEGQIEVQPGLNESDLSVKIYVKNSNAEISNLGWKQASFQLEVRNDKPYLVLSKQTANTDMLIKNTTRVDLNSTTIAADLNQ